MGKRTALHFFSLGSGLNRFLMTHTYTHFLSDSFSQCISAMLLSIDTQVAGVIAVSDPLRPEAKETLQRLSKMGISLGIISGFSSFFIFFVVPLLSPLLPLTRFFFLSFLSFD